MGFLKWMKKYAKDEIVWGIGIPAALIGCMGLGQAYPAELKAGRYYVEGGRRIFPVTLVPSLIQEKEGKESYAIPFKVDNGKYYAICVRTSNLVCGRPGDVIHIRLSDKELEDFDNGRRVCGTLTVLAEKERFGRKLTNQGKPYPVCFEQSKEDVPEK